jgi:prefoldin subunit 5
MADAIRLADIERMLADHLQQRGQIAALLRGQIEAREAELPALRRMLETLDEVRPLEEVRTTLVGLGASPSLVEALRRGADGIVSPADVREDLEFEEGGT